MALKSLLRLYGVVIMDIKWCLKQKKGLEIIEPNENMSKSYLKMAEESLEELKRMKNKIWIASASYYVMYYSLYSLMMKIGIKCEIHSCSLLFMKLYLGKFFCEKDMEMINEAFHVRNDLQYYPGKDVLSSLVLEIKEYASDFYANAFAALSKVTENDVKEINARLNNTSQ